MKRLHVVSAVVGVPVAMVLVGVLIVLAMPDWLDRMVVRQLGTLVSGELRADLSPQVLFGAPELDARDLRWRPPAGLPGHIHVAQAKARTAWRAGPTGGRSLALALRGGEIELHQKADGRWIVPELIDDGAAGATPTPTPPLQLTDLSVEDVSVRLVPHEGEPIDLGMSRGALSADGPGWRLRSNIEMNRAGLHLAGEVRAHVAIAGAVLTLGEAHFSGALTQAGLRIELPRLSARVLRIEAGVLKAAGVAGQARLPSVGDLGASTLTVDLPVIEGAPEAWSGQVARIEAAAEGALGARAVVVDGVLTGALSTLQLAPLLLEAEATPAIGRVAVQTQAGHLDLDVDTGALTLAGVGWRGQLPDPAAPTARVDLSGQVDGTLTTAGPTARLTLVVRAEASTATGGLDYDAQAVPPVRIRATVDRLDLDRWTPPADPQDEGGMALDVWRDWPLRLDLQVGRLTWQGFDVRDARVQLGESADTPQ